MSGQLYLHFLKPMQSLVFKLIIFSKIVQNLSRKQLTDILNLEKVIRVDSTIISFRYSKIVCSCTVIQTWECPLFFHNQKLFVYFLLKVGCSTRASCSFDTSCPVNMVTLLIYCRVLFDSLKHNGIIVLVCVHFHQVF